MRKLIKAKYLGPTCTKGARVSIYDMFEQERKTINYDYSKNSVAEIVMSYLKDINNTSDDEMEELYVREDEYYLAVNIKIKIK